MSVNKHRPHLIVLPEDDANAALINGFKLEIPSACTHAFQDLSVAGGWLNVIKEF